MTSQWHYTSNGVPAGPVTSDDLRKLASEGKLKQTDLVWKDGMKAGVYAESLKNLFSTLPQSASQAETINTTRNRFSDYLRIGIKVHLIKKICSTYKKNFKGGIRNQFNRNPIFTKFFYALSSFILMAIAAVGFALGVLRMGLRYSWITIPEFSVPTLWLYKEFPLEVLLVIGCTSQIILLWVREGLLKGAVWMVIFFTLILGVIVFQFPTIRNWLEIEYKQIKIRLFWRGENGESTSTSVSTAFTYSVLPNGKKIILENNPNAINPSMNELLKFLKKDKTDTHAYIEDKFVCANFALMLHNNAEIAGWRCAYVNLVLSGKGHSLNAFKTTDYGIVYIDCGNPLHNPSSQNNDKRVKLTDGIKYLPEPIFDDTTYTEMGIISNITIYW